MRKRIGPLTVTVGRECRQCPGSHVTLAECNAVLAALSPGRKCDYPAEHHRPGPWRYILEVRWY